MSTKKPVVQIKEVHYRVLRNITVDFPSGLTIVSGANGSGKTSLMRLIAGLDMPEKGVVRVYSLEPRKALHSGLIAVSLHPPYFDPTLTVREFLQLHDSLCKGVPLRDVTRRLNLHSFFDKRIYELSSGQRKRTDLARVFNCLPKNGILLLDEPSESLDTASRSLLIELISESLNIVDAVIVSTHDELFARDLGKLGISSYIMLDKGKAHKVSLSATNPPALTGSRASSRGITFTVKAVVRGNIPITELRSIPGVLSVDFQPDIDWVLQRLGLDRSSLGNVIMASTGGLEKSASGYSTIRLDSIMVRFDIVVEDYNALVRALSKLLEYGSIEHLSIGGHR